MNRFLSTPKLFIALVAAALSIGTTPASAGGFKDQGANPSWGGLYIAGSVGYSFGEAKDTLELTTFPTARDNVDIDGFTGTASIGYDYMLTPRVLVGLFGDYTFGELDGSGARVYPDTTTVDFGVSVDKMWSVGARIGLVHAGDSLFYLMGGYTQANLEYSDQFDSGDFDIKGYFIGAGFERMLRDRWFLRAEYRFSDFGKETIFTGTCTTACGGAVDERERIDTKIHAFRLGIVYKLTEDPAPAYQPYK